MRFIEQWLLSALSFLLVAWILPGITLSSLYIALIVALIWGFINFFVKPVLQALALPITILSLGLFYFVLNGLLFWFVSSFIQGFEVRNLWWAMLGALFVSFFNWLGNKYLFKTRDDKPYFRMKEVK
jgi:putative membrane protein